MIDLGTRGGVIDYRYIPGHFAADMKDIVGEVFVASALIEAIDNPRIFFRWTGWRHEFRDLQGLVGSVFRLALSGWRGLRK